MKIALWVARHHRPFAIVEDKELVDIFTDLNNKVEVPSRFTVSRDVKEIFLMSRLKVSEILKVCDVIRIVICSDPTNNNRLITESYTSAPTAGHLQMSSLSSASPSTGPKMDTSNPRSSISSSMCACLFRFFVTILIFQIHIRQSI
jgi:hypothetical protein